MGIPKTDKYFLEKIRMKVVRAMEDYDLLRPGDKILIALSGGKDSVVLADALQNKKKYFSFKYELLALTVELPDVGYLIDWEKIKHFCSQRGIPFVFVSDDTKIITAKKQPCFYCAWNRRRNLFEYAVQNGFNKVAFGHNMDDAVETFFMNMIYHAEASAFPVRLSMFEGKLEIIRPLIYVSNREARRYIKILGYEPVPYNCPHAQFNEREKFRNWLQESYLIHPHAVENIFKSMQNIKPAYLPVKKPK